MKTQLSRARLLVLGVVLGIAVALPATVLAATRPVSSGPGPGDSRMMGRMMNSMMTGGNSDYMGPSAPGHDDVMGQCSTHMESMTEGMRDGMMGSGSW